MQTLRLFCDVARHRSFSRAAAEHGITQSAVSQRMSQLEKKLGVPLLDRSVRPLELTAAGREFQRGGLDLLQRHERLEQKVSQFRQLEGHVHVGAIYSAGIDLLNHIRENFVREHPRVTVTVDYKRPDEVYDQVRQGRSDLGILSYPRHWREVSLVQLRDERMVVVCQPNHALAQQMEVDASQLADWPMVAFEPQLPVARHIRKYLRDNGVTPAVSNVFDNIDTIKSALMMAGCSGDMSILPRRTVLPEVAAGTLAVVELTPKLVRPMGIIYARRSGNGFTPVVQAFVNFLVQHAGPQVDVDRNDAPRPQLVGDQA